MKKNTQDTTNLFRVERRHTILAQLRREGKVFVNELSTSFNVSGATIRQDLAIMETQGLLTRTHGGAVEKTKTSIDIPLDERNTKRLPQKTAIAMKALEFVSDGDSLILDGGTTILEFTKILELSNRANVNVVLNFIPHITVLEKSNHIRMIVLGGSYDESLRSLVGLITVDSLSTLYADTAFISTTGISMEQGITCTSLMDAEVRKTILNRAKKKILLADSGKIGKNSFISVADLKQVDILITDWEIAESDYNMLVEFGLKVIVAPKLAP
ncbi:Glucitol operon repressor [bioreactor metagenome]|uniref:Glucitol operon repressor n=1 Tax=bioreactor metagenome TaxID=1076179 RepID=A0A644Y6W6_9ZZZZ|nr:DeoR/GlpR transcriptional regulator [Bacilli bacterium]